MVDRPTLVVRDGLPVMLDVWVADAFEVETRAVNQAVARNPKKFDARHAFRLTKSERDFLRSQGVIPKPEGRGGSRVMPMVYTQLGIARLATILDAPKALEATDQMLAVFTEVYVQIAQGSRSVSISNPSQLIPATNGGAQARSFKENVLKQLDSLLSTDVFNEGKTMRDELSDAAQAAYKDLTARMKTRTLENEKLAAEALKILEEVAQIKETRLKTQAETEAIKLDNLTRKIDIVERSLKLADVIEPSALVQLGAGFLPAPDANVLVLPTTLDEVPE